ncbi:hypothetical protein EYF80_034362 [Liparis tanakae]|uniref:Uncharacterized protein n=1 Tax=Liparis tanakae TaxID=230148 RepID=A0A4Z2GRS0_9TELE|nr:hypothetical protein EYF80_034362 [Liparis tanakae]
MHTALIPIITEDYTPSWRRDAAPPARREEWEPGPLGPPAGAASEDSGSGSYPGFEPRIQLAEQNQCK